MSNQKSLVKSKNASKNIKNKILIVSDTHKDLLLLKQLIDKNDFDLIIHAGDYERTINEIKSLVNFVVCGNNDQDGKEYEIFKIGNFKFLITHGHRFFSYDKNKWHHNLIEFAKKFNCNVIVYGHSHIPFVGKIDGIWVINPGSLIRGRDWQYPRSYIVCKIDDSINFEIKNLKD